MEALARILIALLVFGGLLWAVEERWPALRRPRWRPDSRTDLVYWFFTPIVTRAITGVAVAVAILLLALAHGVQVTEESGVTPLVAGSWIGQQPRWVEITALVLVLDFLGYWLHRAFHRGRLWPFHAIHHSSTGLDWLSSVRVHPVNDLVSGVARALALILLGFDPPDLAVAVPFFALYGLLLHANVPWDFGSLRYVIASPRFHRWHHTSENEGRDRNFSGLLPVWDLIFGTFYMPLDRQPVAFGVDEAVPAGIIGQMIWPFRRRARAAATDDQ